MLQKGMAQIKQVLASVVVVMVAAGILTGMVLYSIFLMRSTELQILTGEKSLSAEFRIDDLFN